MIEATIHSSQHSCYIVLSRDGGDRIEMALTEFYCCADLSMYAVPRIMICVQQKGRRTHHLRAKKISRKKGNALRDNKNEI
jgi:hypothetical protein